MMTDPAQEILGVPMNSDAYTLLGITPERCSTAEIEKALLQRIGRVYQHPEGRSAAGVDVIHALRRAAAQLRDPQQRAAVGYDAPQLLLTPFDREVLAILIGYGGWNAASRARLVALAAAHGVTAQGLIRIVGGLSRHARTSHRRLDISQMLSGVTRPTIARDESRPGPMVEIAELLVDRFAPVLRERTTRATFMLSAVFGAVALVIAIVAVALFAPAPVTTHLSGNADDSVVASSALTRSRTGAAEDPAPARPIRPSTPLKLETLPTFSVSATPPEAVSAADDFGRAADELDAISRRLTVNVEPAEATFHRWNSALATGSAGWMLAGEQDRLILDRRIVDVLTTAASAPHVSDRLLAGFEPPSFRLAQPLDVLRGAWRVGTLGRLASHPRLPPVIIDQAGTRVDRALDEPLPAGRLSFEAAATAWLDQVAPELVSMLEVDDQAYAYWELWLAAQRRLLTDRDSLNSSLLRAARLILEQGADLSRPGPRQNVLGRLIAAVDYPGSNGAKQALSALYLNEHVSSSNLWVLTSLLAADPRQAWFTEGLVVSPDAPLPVRRRAADDMRQAWPALSPARAALEAARERGLVVDGALRRRWDELADRMRSRRHAIDAAAIMREIEITARLNEAAALLAADAVDRSDRVMRELATLLDQDDTEAAAPSTPPTALGGPASRGQPPGQDGAWTAAYEQVRRNTDERIRLLQALRADHSDLGPRDAATFVREVYRATPVEVREAAQIALVDRFVNGPTVAVEMVNQYPDAPRTQWTTDAIVHYTGLPLPSYRSDTWAIECRLALVNHALEVLNGSSAIDEIAAELADTYSLQASVLRAGGTVTSTMRPMEALRMLHETWRDLAHAKVVAEPVPDDLPALDRRHQIRLRLAEGPVQESVAHQVSILELAAYVTAAERPARGNAMLTILRDSAATRRQARSVLEQSLAVERAMTDVWRWRLGTNDESPDEEDAS